MIDFTCFGVRERVMRCLRNCVSVYIHQSTCDNAVADIKIVPRIVAPECGTPAVLRVAVGHCEVEHVATASLETLARLTVIGIEVGVARLNVEIA